MTDAAVPIDGTATATAPASDVPWSRLSARVIWADLLRSLASLSPAAVAIFVVGVEPSWSTLWPVILVGAWGVVGAVADVIRWAFTRYRVTDAEVHRRTGLLVRRYRTVRRDRIRSVDTHAKLRHRLAGLRVVEIGAGQQNTAGESAFSLDALRRSDAAALRALLLREVTAQPDGASVAATDHSDDGATTASDGEPTPTVQVFAELRPWWVVYNMLGIWGFFTAAGLLWGTYWFMTIFGVDLWQWLTVQSAWTGSDWTLRIVAGVIAAAVLGAIGMAVNFFTGYWRFELARVRTSDGSVLRTRRGLLSTREVNRDEARVRGLTISEPLLWRWMGMADTTVITTGLGIWSMEQPASLLPRGPVRVARSVARQVLGDPSPLEQRLRRHPVTALRRRLWWATLLALAVLAVVAWPTMTGAVPTWVWWLPAGAWALALAGAVASYLALGHAIVDDYLVVRSGMLSRNASAVRRDAVSTIAVRQSLLQRRLGLATVSAMTAAGWFAYEAPDVADSEAFAFARDAAPGLLDAYVTER